MQGVRLQAIQPHAQYFTESSLEGWGGWWEDMEVLAYWMAGAASSTADYDR